LDYSGARRRKQLKAGLRKQRTSAYYDTDKELTPAVARREAAQAGFVADNYAWGIRTIAVIIDRIFHGLR
jgi:hypothetical protein